MQKDAAVQRAISVHHREVEELYRSSLQEENGTGPYEKQGVLLSTGAFSVFRRLAASMNAKQLR